jgi:hypothetical protein
MSDTATIKLKEGRVRERRGDKRRERGEQKRVAGGAVRRVVREEKHQCERGKKERRAAREGQQDEQKERREKKSTAAGGSVQPVFFPTNIQTDKHNKNVLFLIRTRKSTGL